MHIAHHADAWCMPVTHATQGRPVLIYKIGSTDVSALKKEFPEAALRRFHVQTYEFIMRVALPACSLAAGRHVDQVTTIVDLEGMGLW